MSRRSIAKNIIKHTTYQGVLRGNRKGFAFLARTDGGDDLFVPHAGLHGAQNGDTVLCRLVGGDNVEVLKILKRGVEQLVGTLLVYQSGAFVQADDDAYFSDVHIADVPQEAQTGHKVLVQITDYPKGRNPEGRIVRVLGFAGEKQSEVLSCLYGHGFRDGFDDDVLAAADALTMEDCYDGREDLRSMLTITIDGDDARDFDDAISLARTAGGGYELWVHIADVSHFVKDGDVIDNEAYRRGTSVYFPRQAFSMLPPALCNNLCSLVEGQDRLCLSCRMRFTSHGERKSVRLVRSVIRSNHRMTYANVQGILQGDEALCNRYQDIVKMLGIAQELARLLRDKRMARGAIDFAGHETAVQFDGERITGVAPYPLYESNGMIEDFMIAANEAVADTLQQAGYPCAYRVHDVPDEDKLRTLTAFAECFGLAPVGRYLNEKEICDFIRACQNTPYAEVISAVAIRCMQKAKYSPQNVGHYGLGSECYCHFTSPIRRYPDLMVHRLVKRYLAANGAPMSEEERDAVNEALESSCVHCSLQERAAEKAERDIIRYYEAVYMQDHIDETFAAIVSGMNATMLFATLPNGIEGAVPVEDMRDTFYYDSMRYQLVGTHSRYRIGDEIKVVVTQSDPSSRRIRFALCDNRHSATVGEVYKPMVRGGGNRAPQNGMHGTVRTRDHKKPKPGNKQRRRK